MDDVTTGANTTDTTRYAARTFVVPETLACFGENMIDTYKQISVDNNQ